MTHKTQSNQKKFLNLGFIHGAFFHNSKIKQACQNWFRLQKLNGWTKDHNQHAARLLGYQASVGTVVTRRKLYIWFGWKNQLWTNTFNFTDYFFKISSDKIFIMHLTYNQQKQYRNRQHRKYKHSSG